MGSVCKQDHSPLSQIYSVDRQFFVMSWPPIWRVNRILTYFENLTMRHKLPFCVGKPTPQTGGEKSQFTLFKIHLPKALPRPASVFQAECFYSVFWRVLKNTYRMLKIFILKEKLVALMEQHMYLFNIFNEENVLHAFRRKKKEL